MGRISQPFSRPTSAGAQLALLEAYASGDESIRGVVSSYGPTDLLYAYAHPVNPRVANIQRLLEDYRLVQYDFSIGERYVVDEMWYPFE